MRFVAWAEQHVLPAVQAMLGQQGSRAAAGDATAGAKAFEEALSRMNGGLCVVLR